MSIYKVANKDYFDDLGEVALGSRLKRLSDRVMSDAARVYQYTGHDMQPKWFTLMSLLADKKKVSVVQAADFLGLSQPCISQFSRELLKKGWLQVQTDANDLRRKIMSLTTKGKRQYKKMQPMRQSVHAAAVSICQELDQDFYQALKQFEQALERKSLYHRTLESLHGN
ncbi:MAG TPA: MarR family transcriptional regulator [Oceanospirillales bacterium]|nr:MarR family transcriptional regulator [Oceanospirillales bacterium]